MFKFTIRDLLWLTFLAAVAVAWGIRSHAFRVRSAHRTEPRHFGPL